MVAAPEDPGQFDLWDPANISPLVAYLATEDCPFNGGVFHVGANEVGLYGGWSLQEANIVVTDGRWTVPTWPPRHHACSRAAAPRLDRHRHRRHLQGLRQAPAHTLSGGAGGHPADTAPSRRLDDVALIGSCDGRRARAAPSSVGAQTGGPQPAGPPRELFSASVRAAPHRLDDQEVVSPAEPRPPCATSTRRMRVGASAPFQFPPGSSPTTLNWILDRIVGLHDLAALEAERQRIHTRMVLLDLADLDAGVAAVLGDDLRACAAGRGRGPPSRMFRRADSPVGALAPKISGYRPDNLAGADQLQMSTDIETVARLLAAVDTRPPLAVGLFGEWGTGKSFFMTKLAAEIGRLASLARDQGDAGFVSPYCEHIVQIPFNAWHYVDANLWANLMTRIWDGLGSVEGNDHALDAVFANLDSTRAARRQAQLDVDIATQRLEQLDEEIETLESQTRSVDLDDEAVRDELDASIAKVSAELGVPADVSGLRRVVAAHRRMAGRLALVWRNLSPRRRSILVGVVAVAVALAAVIWLVAGQQVAAGVAAAVTIVAALFPLLSPVLSKVNRAVVEADALLGAIDRRRQVALADLGRRRADAEADRRAAQERRDAARRELDELRSGRGVQRFIRDRAASADYREQLGLIALVRRDLETLSAMLVPPEDDLFGARRQLPGAPPKLDRIVLYVDDLDRCPPDRVVEVLQAVHLLLAFPLFVVVVAVDPRWLMSSLELHLRRQVAPTATPPGARVTVDEWTSTPSDYLEKIFQLTLALVPMDNEGYGRLVRSLVTIADPDDGGDDEDDGDDGTTGTTGTIGTKPARRRMALSGLAAGRGGDPLTPAPDRAPVPAASAKIVDASPVATFRFLTSPPLP